MPRSIPARTGEPAQASPNNTWNWVYPRAYGGTRLTLSMP